HGMKSSSATATVAQQVRDHLAKSSGVIGPVDRNWAEWDLALNENEDHRLDVVPVTTKIQLHAISREKVKYVVPVDVVLRKRFLAWVDQSGTDGETASHKVDSLTAVVEHIAELFCMKRLSDELKPVFVSCDI